MVWDMPAADVEQLKKSRVVLSLSGGKDSTACALLLERHGIEFTSVFFDTGWEHPALYDYLHNVLGARFGEIEVIKSAVFPGGMAEAVRRKGIFPSSKIRWCTDELKIRPRDRYLKTLEGDVVHVVGIRREESPKRARYPRWDYSDSLDLDMFYPLVDHTFNDVIRMHQEAGLEPNPLYLKGLERVGCFPCIFARKSELAKLAELYPDRIAEIEALEAEVTERAQQKNPSAMPRTFFGPRTGSTELGIRAAVEWAQTDRGGRQFRLFDETAQTGCTRWGMCDLAMSAEQLRELTEGGE